MRRKHLLISLALLTVLLLIPVVSVQAGRPQDLILDWHKVVPEGSGDPNMYGDGTLDVNAGRGQLCYSMRIYLILFEWPPTGATIHQAPAGEKGPVVFDLKPQFGPLGDTHVSACLNISKDLAHAIQKNPSQYYVLVTAEDYPDGAARAQLSK
jgi:hypothetical protein